MADHHFSDAVVKAFISIGDYDFFNKIENSCWSTRSRRIAKQRMYEKYIKPEDVFKAAWLQKQARNTPGGTFESPYYWGNRYIKEVLQDRSQGRYSEEMSALMKTLPTTFEYAIEECGEAYTFESPVVELKLVISNPDIV